MKFFADTDFMNILVFLNLLHVSYATDVGTDTFLNGSRDAIIHPSCSPSEVSLWRGKQEFSNFLHKSAQAHYAMPGPIKKDMQAQYPELSDLCVNCFTDNIKCGALYCFALCALDSLSDRCLSCCSTNCNPALQVCLGVTKSQMPLIPTRVPKSTPVPTVWRTRTRKSIGVTPSIESLPRTTINNLTNWDGGQAEALTSGSQEADCVSSQAANSSSGDGNRTKQSRSDTEAGINKWLVERLTSLHLLVAVVVSLWLLLVKGAIHSYEP